MPLPCLKTRISQPASSSHPSNDCKKGLLPILGWGKEDVQEFQRIWMTMKRRSSDGMSDLGIAILIWILEYIPAVRDLFQIFDGAVAETYTMEKNPKTVDETFLEHSLNLVYALDKMIAALDDSPESLKQMRGIAQTHINRNVKTHHFEQIRDKFHILLYELIREEKTSRAGLMWFNFFDAMCTIYREEEEIAHQDGKHMSCCSIA